MKGNVKIDQTHKLNKILFYPVSSPFVTKKDIRLSSLFGKKSSTGRLPKLIDILTIITTITGLVAAIGLGTTQIEGGISHLIQKPPALTPILPNW